MTNAPETPSLPTCEGSHSLEQAAEIAQIKAVICQVTSVVQSNAAITEENTSTSSELANHATHLENLISVFIVYSKRTY